MSHGKHHHHGEHEHHHHGEHEHHHHPVGGSGQAFLPSERPKREARVLIRGEGKGKILYFDAFSGAAGDMIVGALLDLGVPRVVVEEAIASTKIDGYRLIERSGRCGSIGATKFDVEVAPRQPQRSYTDIVRILAESTLTESVKTLAARIFLRLAKAEADVHRTTIEEVHFHEVGAVDSIVDIVGAAACFDYLGADVYVSPLPMGRGFVLCQHGQIPLPAPATVGCLEGLETYDGKLNVEFVTPTAAAIFGAIAVGSMAWPPMKPVSTGWGAGSRSMPDRPNVLRVILGEPSTQFDRGNEEQSAHSLAVIEANVDDMTGELASHCVSRLMAMGALDVWTVPVIMKKGRPGIVLSALVSTADVERVSAEILRESTSLGVRQHRVSRVVRPRQMVEVVTQYGPVRAKVSGGDFGPPQVKPEFDDCVRLAEDHRVPVREVLVDALAEARRAIRSDSKAE